MIKNNIFNTPDILGKAIGGAWARNEAIASNIANVDTPGYKRKEVVFEKYLQDALRSDGKITTKELDRIKPKTITDINTMSYRLDGNNVDVDAEMGYMAENQLRYNALVTQVNYNFERIKSVLNN